jgi:LPXTG-motif cell wall-anchored protein
VATHRLRTEIIRFGLLLTMTVALISVATRHGDHGSGREAVRTHGSGQTATPTTGGSSGPATSSQTPAPPPTTTSHHASHGGTSSPGQVGGVGTLPNTGSSTQTIELAALALLFIAGGSLSVRISRPKQAAGQAGSATAVAQSAQAAGSPASNRPGTC